ncbi:hypothetical protein CDAR_73561 [Caerostris darwini]|uniref:Uncharacterized protein n=1 Tax=Caerostris darwini TaxID=1538125 RepID=A0AAV4VKG5_9ARAC|nr:hypothetical protein CDAR_73561 [Caerostris darwini]
MMANLLLYPGLFILSQKLLPRKNKILNNYLPSFGFRPEEFTAAMRSGASDTPPKPRARRGEIFYYATAVNLYLLCRSHALLRERGQKRSIFAD